MSIPGRMARWMPLLLYSALIFYLSSAPAPGFTDTGIPGSDKVLHVGAFTVWGFLCGWALAGDGHRARLRGWTFILIVTAAGTAYGLTDELHQTFVKERTADHWDLLADLAGSLLGACLAYGWAHRGARAE